MLEGAAARLVGSALNQVLTWPLASITQVDVGNEKCFGMKPPGWHGWKLGVGTATKPGAGTNGDISVSLGGEAAGGDGLLHGMASMSP